MRAQIGTERDQFFQTDEQVKANERRKHKKDQRGETVGNPIQVESKILDLVVHPFQSNIIYLALASGLIRKMDLSSKRTLLTLIGHKGPVTSLSLAVEASNKNEEYLISGSWDKTLIKWCVKTSTPVHIYQGHSDFVKCVAVARVKDKTYVYSGSSDKQIRKWSYETSICLAYFEAHTRPVEHIEADLTSQYLYSASADLTIKKWDLLTNQLLFSFSAHHTTIYKLLIPNEDEIWSVSADKTARRWNVKTGQQELCYEHPDFVKCIVVSDEYAITGCRDENIRIWRLSDDSLVTTLHGHYDEVSALQLIHLKDEGPNHHTYLISVSLDGTLRTWPLERFLNPTKNNTAIIDQPNSEALDAHVNANKSMLTKEEELELEELMNDS